MSSTNPRGTRLAAQDRRWWHRLPPVAFTVALLLPLGCHRDASAPYPNWIPEHAAPVRHGAYAELRQVGVEAEAAVRGLQNKAAPSSREVKAMDAKLAPLMASVAKACSLPVVDDYVLEPPLTPSLSRIGWAALGGAYERRLHAALVKQDFNEAVRVEAEGTRFALIITCGDASDALVGYPIADSLRRIMAPALRDLEAAQLSKLAEALTASLLDRLEPVAVAVHEHLAIMAAIQALQDAYRDGRLSGFAGNFGLATKEALDSLESDRGRAESKRATFFAGMAADANDEAAWLEKACTTPGYLRPPEPYPKSSTKAPWHGAARNFTLTGGALLTAGDCTIARTRLLALTCDLFAIGKTSGAVPLDLRLFPPDLNRDPYSSKPFIFVPEGLDFRLYSVGIDGIDNGGDTDDTGTSPDLFLEGFY